MGHPCQFHVMDELYRGECERSHCDFCRCVKDKLYGRTSLSFFNIFTLCIKSLKTGLSIFVSSDQEVPLLPMDHCIAIEL